MEYSSIDSNENEVEIYEKSSGNITDANFSTLNVNECGEDEDEESEAEKLTDLQVNDSSSFEEEYIDYYSELLSDVDLGFEPVKEKSLVIPEKKVEEKQLSIIETRLNLISQLKHLWEERKLLKLTNKFLHRKCKDYLGKYKIMSYFEKTSDSSSIYSDKRYIEILDTFKQAKFDTEAAERLLKSQLMHLNDNYQDNLVVFNNINQKCIDQQLATFEILSGKCSPKKFQFLMRRQSRRLNHLTQVRIKFFKLCNLLDRIEDESDRLNDFGQGQTVNHYTNLVATKNRLLERVDEREDDVGRLRKNIFSTAPILSHTKETSQGLSIESDSLAAKLKEINDAYEKNRTFVGKERKMKVSLRKKFSKLHQTAFLLVRPKLLEYLLNSMNEFKELEEKIINL